MTLSRRCAALSAFTLLAFAPVSSTWAAGAPQPLTSCGQDVFGDVYLTGDLDCTGVGGTGVNLRRRATLELRGFSIRNADDYAVQCFRNCDIVGPGTLGGSFGGVWAPHRLTMTDVIVEDNEVLGIGTGRLKMERCTVSGGRYGIQGGVRASLVDSTVTGSEGTGVMVQASISFFGTQVCTRGKLSLVNSTVTGNVLDPNAANCADKNACADISTCLAPRLDAASSCGTSSRYDDAGSWGACDLD